MSQRVRHFWIAVAGAWALVGGVANGQAPTIDTSIPPLPGSTSSLLGQPPGAGGGSGLNLPGSNAILGSRPGPTTAHGIPTAASTPGVAPSPTAEQSGFGAPAAEPVSPFTVPPYGTLDLPTGPDDLGPPNGLTLDLAIDTTLQRSLDLKAKFFEIPQAQADLLQAGLRANPIFYADGQLLQYANRPFSKAVPGGPSQFDINVTYPIDASHKRQARIVVATRAKHVLEAAYQDAVRQRIDDVYSAYVDALAARQTVRYSRESVRGLESLLTRTEQLYRRGQVSLSDFNRVKIQLRTARLGLLDAETAYRRTKLDLGALLNLNNRDAERLELRGTIQDEAPRPPPLEELFRIARESRPDLVAFRLGVRRAEADVRLARANALNDIYVLYQPYTFQDNTPYGMKSQYSWALGVTVPLPVYNRNQGGIQRARLNVTQTQIQLADLERQVLIDVEKAAQEYQATRREVEEIQSDILPTARQVRDEAGRLYLAGETSIVALINAQLDFNLVLKQYLDTAIRHRRSMLALNTAVGLRILP